MIYSVVSRLAHLPILSKVANFIYRIHSKHFEQTLELSVESASKKIDAVYTKPEGTVRWNRSHEVKCDLSIIIPFYKTERFAQRCIESVLLQESKYTVEVILVDDGSPDNCGKILDSYGHRDDVIVIHQRNAGLSEARNTGLRIASGEYILFVDSDDILCPNAVSVLLDTARRENADIVEGGHYTFDDSKRRKEYLHTHYIGHNGRNMFGYAWGKVMRSKLFDRVCFPAGYWYEDTIISSHIYPMANVTVCLPEIVVGYYVNQKGITAQTKSNVKCVDSLYIVEILLEEFANRKMLYPFQKHAYLNQLSVFLFHRTKYLQKDLQKAVFILAADMVFVILRRTVIMKMN